MSESEKNKEKLEEEIDITLKKLELIERHIENVQKACKIIGKKLIESGEIDFGVQLIAKSYLHDQSKFLGIEWSGLFQTDNKELLKLAIKEHRIKNSHHPHYWLGGISEMPRIALAELTADLYARATEKGQCLNDFLKEEYFPQHNVKQNSNIHKIIKEFVNLLLDDSFVKLK